MFLTTVAQRKLTMLLAAGALLIGPAVSVAYAQTTTASIPVIGCGASASPLDTDAETNDENENSTASSDESDNNAPTIVGSVKAPQGTKENDKSLSPLAKISSAQARDAALAVITDANQRQVSSTGLELEQGYVVYAVKTVRSTSGGDPKLEVKVDAGNGAILMMECDPNDN